jgi:hypothetical protein
MCELAFNVVGERHGMCESALSVPPPGFIVRISHAVQPTLLRQRVSKCSPASKLASSLQKTFDTHRTACVEILATSLKVRISIPVTTVKCSCKLHIFVSHKQSSEILVATIRELSIVIRRPRAATEVTDGQPMTNVAST